MNRTQIQLAGDCRAYSMAGLVVILSLTACSGYNTLATVSAKDPGVSSESFTEFPCPPPRSSPEENSKITDHRNAIFYGEGFALNVTVDYFAVRRVGLHYPEAERGMICSTAQDRTGCQARFDEMLRTPAPKDSMRRARYKTPYLITTRGDEVKLWSPGEFIKVLGPIDTPVEAWLMIRTHRDLPYLSCIEKAPTYRSVPGGFEIREQHGTKGCHPFEIVETLHYVGEDGGVRVLNEHVVLSDPDRCMVD